MAVSTKSSGTQTATLATEHTLLDTPDAGAYQLKVNLENLANGETVELKIYDKVLAADAYVAIWTFAYIHARGTASPIIASPPLMMPYGGKFTLKQTGGTGRAFKWSVVQA